MAEISPRERLIVALDVPSVGDAQKMIECLGDTVCFYKVGYQLAFAGGLALAEQLVSEGKRIFLDLKLHDIGNTVAKGVESVARIGATFLTVHAYPQTMRAAVKARSPGLRILAVTVLTSYNDEDLAEAGYNRTIADLVARRADQALEIGVDGLVCSAVEVAPLRRRIGVAMTLVTPGVRPLGAASGDQKRIVAPGQAIALGADYLVVGRPILEAPDPRHVADAVIDEIAGAV
jgi:orotidine-5'-phosphate decarboxylase